MTISQYESITGTTVPTSKQSKVTAMLAKTQRILEDMLGFTLDIASVELNQYTETGKTSTNCPCPSSTATLLPPDAVVGAYRLFPYNINDKNLLIDPASAVHSVKLVKDGVTYKTLDPDYYRLNYKNGIIKYIEQIECFCSINCCTICDFVQLAVDADWLWSTTIPNDLLDVQAEMTEFYSSSNKDLRSETLGSHSYTKADTTPPELRSYNMKIIEKYAGPNGSIKKVITL